jgi:hypothetical protein
VRPFWTVGEGGTSFPKMIVLHRIIVCPPTPLFANLVWLVKLVFLIIIVIIAVTNIGASKKGVINVGMMHFMPIATLGIEDRIEGEVYFFIHILFLSLFYFIFLSIFYNGNIFIFILLLISLQCHHGFIPIIFVLTLNFLNEKISLNRAFTVRFFSLFFLIRSCSWADGGGIT